MREVEGNELIIGTIDIGARRLYRHRPASSRKMSSIGDGAELGDLTAIGAGGRVGAWESLGRLAGPQGRHGRSRRAGPAAHGFAARAGGSSWRFMYVVLLLAMPPLGLLPIFPAFWVFDRIDDLIGTADFDRTLYMLSIPIMAWPTAFVMVLVTVGSSRLAAGSSCRGCAKGLIRFIPGSISANGRWRSRPR